MARPASDKPFSHSVRLTDDGLHLVDSILSFDAHDSGQLSFLSSALQPLRGAGPRMIASQETAKILQGWKRANSRNPNNPRPNTNRLLDSMLVCQYNRPFSLGKLKIELLPSGAVLGGALLHVETEKGKLLYAPAVQTNRITTVRQYQIKKATTLVLGAFHDHPEQSLPQRKLEKERLLAAVDRCVSKGVWPVIVCQSLGTGQEITRLLTEHGLGVSAHSSIHRHNTVYEDCGVTLGKYSRYGGGRPKQKILLMPLSPPHRRRVTTAPKILGLPTFYVEDSMTPSSELVAFHEVAERFVLSSTSDGPELKAFIESVGAREVYLFGPYVKRYADAWKDLGVKIKPLYPHNQPSLF